MPKTVPFVQAMLLPEADYCLYAFRAASPQSENQEITYKNNYVFSDGPISHYFLKTPPTATLSWDSNYTFHKDIAALLNN